MSDGLEQTLVEALDLLEQGVGVEEILARYPARAADLRPLLVTAMALGKLASQPSLAAQQASRRAFLDQAAALAARPRPRPRRALAWLLGPSLAVVALLFVLGFGLVNASTAAVPGDALYEAKRFVEDIRLAVAVDPQRAAGLRERYRLERVDEIRTLLGEGRTARVVFTGRLEGLEPGAWLVDGLSVLVNDQTVVDGVPRVGATVQVEGVTEQGALRASRVAVLGGLLPAPSPTPAMAGATPAPAQLATPVGTGAASPTATPSPTVTATLAAGATLQPTLAAPAPLPSATAPPVQITPETEPTNEPDEQPPASPTPRPSPTARPNDNGNDNGDDNGGGNDNHNDNGGGNDNGDDNRNDNGDDNRNDNGDDNSDANANNNGRGDDNNGNNNGNSDNNNGRDNDNHNDNGRGNDDNDNQNDRGD